MQVLKTAHSLAVLVGRGVTVKSGVWRSGGLAVGLIDYLLSFLELDDIDDQIPITAVKPSVTSSPIAPIPAVVESSAEKLKEQHFSILYGDTVAATSRSWVRTQRCKPSKIKG